MTLCAYKTELDLNNAQRTLLRKHAGAARWAYNYGLRRKKEEYKKWVDGGKQGKCHLPSAIDLHREINALKKLPIEQGGIPWMYEVSKCAAQEALRNLDKAYQNFYRRCKAGARQKGFPRFKSKKRGIGTFRLTGSISASFTHVQLPRLQELRLKEQGYLPCPSKDVRVLSATISEKAGRWFVSLQVEQDLTFAKLPLRVLGVDVGISNLAVASDGSKFRNPRALRSSERRVRLLQKAVTRKEKGSNNQKKARRRLAVEFAYATNVRRDATHKATTAIAKRASIVVIESLNVAGMLKNRSLSRALSDAALSEFHRQLEYKVKWRGGELRKADRFYPSSKLCSRCKEKKDVLSLSEREYVCAFCGLRIDRDLNAALNLESLAGSYSVSACCPGSSGLDRKIQTKLLVGQEPNSRRPKKTGTDG